MSARSQAEWKNRGKELWESYWETRSHPHRQFVLKQLEGKKINSVLEVGCASAPMLKVLGDKFGCKLAGFDISETAIEMAKKNLKNADLRVFDMMSGDFPYRSNQFDLVITDAVLIYVNDNVIENVLREIKRVGRKYFLFVEFHNDKDTIIDGYYAYNYKDLLEELGFKNISLTKITKEIWGEFYWERYGYIITAEK